MGTLSRGDKVRLLAEVSRLDSLLGPAPLRNIDVRTLTPDDVDIVAVGSLVLRSDGKCVLVRRAETPEEWIIPGGTVDAAEDLLETAVREVREETGLETDVDALLRIGLARDYGPEAFRKVNRERFGKDTVSLLFINFRSRERSGSLDCSKDPSSNILEVAAFERVPFDRVAHVYKVLFVQQGLWVADAAMYPAVEFAPQDGR
jgi:8-oxo-dGTP pyrophosphatase MutT (NUDIX family)